MALHTIEPIAHMHTNLTGKFGLPRQAGVVPELTGVITFEPDYRCADALRGLEGFSHIWLLWGFSESAKEEHHGFYGDAPYSPTVRPPRLGGNLRRGVFATRSPFRPNSLGLSCVELKAVQEHPGLGTVLVVRGADLMDGTPIFDVKPYIPYADCHPEARGGFAPDAGATLQVEIPEAFLEKIPADKRTALRGVLANDPRPRYQHDAARVYTMDFAGLTVRFSVDGETLRVREIEDRQ